MQIGTVVVCAVVLGGLALTSCRGGQVRPDTGEAVAMRTMVKQMLYEYIIDDFAAVERIAGGAPVVLFVDYEDRPMEGARRGVDPPKAVLEALGVLGRPVRPVSAVRWDGDGCAYDPETGNPGWIISVTLVSFPNASSVEVEFGAHRGPQQAWGVRGIVRWVPAGIEDNNRALRAEPDGGKWVFESRGWAAA